MRAKILTFLDPKNSRQQLSAPRERHRHHLFPSLHELPPRAEPPALGSSPTQQTLSSQHRAVVRVKKPGGSLTVCVVPCKGNRTDYEGRAFLRGTSWRDQATGLAGGSHLQQMMQRLIFVSASIPASLAFQSQLDFSSCFLSHRHAHMHTNAPPQAAFKFKLSWVGRASCKALGKGALGEGASKIQMIIALCQDLRRVHHRLPCSTSS